jgi:hypothetical protein
LDNIEKLLVAASDLSLIRVIAFNCLKPEELLKEGVPITVGISVSEASRYGLDDRAMEVQSPAEARGFFL